MVERLGQDLPDLLSFYRFPRHLWKKLRSTTIIERCFVEVHRRTRPMVRFVHSRKRGPDYLFDLSPVQFGLADSHPPPIYTSSLTSPNLCEAVRRADHDAVKQDAQHIYQAASPTEARKAFERFRFRWRARYPKLVQRLERDLPELLTFSEFPWHLWRKLRTTNAIERCFVEVWRRTRPMVVFTNVESVDRIIHAIFSRFNQDWKTHTLKLFTQAA